MVNSFKKVMFYFTFISIKIENDGGRVLSGLFSVNLWFIGLLLKLLRVDCFV